jgi:mRNA-degrading endonuclease RelE of RelBE toxin-antitoxin system
VKYHFNKIIFAPEAIQDLKRLPARDRSIMRDVLEQYLRFEPEKVNRSRIKRLRGISRPQYQLRVREIRIFYDVVDDRVEVLAIVRKSDGAAWLAEMGEVD